MMGITSCPCPTENPWGAWQATVHRAEKNQTRPKWFSTHSAHWEVVCFLSPWILAGSVTCVNQKGMTVMLGTFQGWTLRRHLQFLPSSLAQYNLKSSFMLRPPCCKEAQASHMERRRLLEKLWDTGHTWVKPFGLSIPAEPPAESAKWMTTTNSTVIKREPPSWVLTNSWPKGSWGIITLGLFVMQQWITETMIFPLHR